MTSPNRNGARRDPWFEVRVIDQRSAVALLLVLMAACSSEVAESSGDGTRVGLLCP